MGYFEQRKRKCDSDFNEMVKLETKVLKGGFLSDAIEENVLVPQRTFHLQVLEPIFP